MFSEDTLAGNLAALERAQGYRPTLAPLDLHTTRAVPDPQEGLRVEIRTADNAWVPIDARRPALDHAQQVILVGAGLGYALDDLERAGNGSKVIALEPDPGIAVLFLARRDWREWFESGRLRLVTGPTYVGASACARFLDASPRPAIVVNPVLAAHRREAADAAQRVAERIATEAEANEAARRRFAGRYLLQTLGNLPALDAESDVRALDNILTSRPAVIVGAGPSLDTNVLELVHLQDRVVIIAADTALRPLLAAGVRPHLVVAADPSELNARHLSGVERVHEIWLAAEGSVHPAALAGFAGRIFAFKVSDHEPWKTLRQAGADTGLLRAWGSVVTPAIDLAERMGCNPILFAGLDLAYTGMRPYCRHTIYDDMWRSYMEAGCTWDQLVDDFFSRQAWIEHRDIRGVAVRTAPHLVAFRQWILDEVALRRDRRFINATGGGVLHGPGLGQATLTAVLSSCPRLEGVRVALARAHRRGASRSVALTTALERVRAMGFDDIVARWRDFSAQTLAREEIAVAVDSALRESAGRHPRRVADAAGPNGRC
jgi:hypothetical protein